MKKSILLFALLSVGFAAPAQAPFERYYMDGWIASLALDELTSGNMLVGISGVSIMDQQGGILHSRCHDTSPFTRYLSVRRLSDNLFYFVGGFVRDSCAVSLTENEIDPVIGAMDSLGNVLTLQHYQLNSVTCSNTALDLEITSDSGAVAWGHYESFYALRVDAAGGVLWAKQFSHLGGFGFIRELPGGDLLAGFNMDTAGVSVARLDPAGNFLWCKSYFRPKGITTDCLIVSDSSFIVTGYTDSIMPGIGWPPDYHPKLFMMKLDGTGDVQWCKGYDTDDAWGVLRGSQIVRSLDDNFVVLGNIGTPNGGKAYLMKTNVNGDSIWTRAIGVNAYSYNIVSLLATSDGGFIHSGTAEGDFGLSYDAPYLFKTDSLGHLPCSEAPTPTVVVVDLFPVDSSFTLTAVDGAVVLPASNGYLTCPPPTMVDGCTITSVINSMQPRKFRVRPNPTTGRVTVEFKDPLMADSYYSVYDTMGRLLYQRPLPTGATVEEIDLSRYGKGTYAIKLTDKDGVRFERVVLE